VSGVRRSIDTVTASTSTSPTKIAPATAPVAPNASPTARPSTMITPRKTANPTTDRRSNGLRNFTLRYSSRLAFCQIVQATANPTGGRAARGAGGHNDREVCALTPAQTPASAKNPPRRCHRNAGRQQPRWAFAGGGAARIGDGDRG